MQASIHDRETPKVGVLRTAPPKDARPELSRAPRARRAPSPGPDGPRGRTRIRVLSVEDAEDVGRGGAFEGRLAARDLAREEVALAFEVEAEGVPVGVGPFRVASEDADRGARAAWEGKG